MSFSFNFLPSEDDAANHDEAQQSSDGTAAVSLEAGATAPKETWFYWLKQEDVRTSLEDISRNNDQVERASHIVRLSPQETADPPTSHYSMALLRQVQEDLVSPQSTEQFQKTDLVPGVYEGGLKVWECSIDLCIHLYDHSIVMKGHVLELGCGHGLPACWVLKRALSQQIDSCWVTFSDYNEFVLKDVTMKNVFLNAKDACPSTLKPTLKQWLSEHTAFGAGDWNKMSTLLLQPIQQSTESPPAIPKDGYFDFILAAETTYSERAAMETAELIARHLRPKKGVAYIATKRYYFGVRGGTRCLVDALRNQSSHSFDIEVLEEYDSGVGNIRELLLIKSCSS